ncbi:MAG: hypothetical protein Q4C47_03665 [Planctomycetia bacterium]|nr:hypothetical protein [Planctomycetia bacterium]
MNSQALFPDRSVGPVREYNNTEVQNLQLYTGVRNTCVQQYGV